MSVSSETNGWRTWGTQPLASLTRRLFAPATTQPWANRLAGVLVMLYIAFAIGYSTGPIFEIIDEYEHLMMARRMIEVRGLPNALERPLNEYYQPPLYYLPAVPVVALFDEWDTRSDLNPYFFTIPTGLPGNDNKNTIFHWADEQFPYTRNGTVLAVHLIRLLSIAWGVGTLLSANAIFRLLWPENSFRRLIALGILALWPQFLFFSGMVNNDNLLTFLVTLSLYLVLRQQRDGPTYRSAIVLGLALGAALLAKGSAVLLALPTGVAMLWDRRAWRFIPVTLAVVIVVAGWWYVRNIILYGELSGLATMVEISDGYFVPGGAVDLRAGLPRMAEVYATFWARVGNNVRYMPGFVLRVFDALVILTVAGLLLRLALAVSGKSPWPDPLQRKQAAVIGVLLIAWLIESLIAASWMLWGDQGRYLLPSIAGWGILIGLGIEAWIPRSRRLLVGAAYGVALLLSAWLSLFGAYLPAYAVERAPSQIEHPLALVYADVAQLTGSDPSVVHARSGEWVTVRLYWRALRPADGPLLSYIHSLDGGPVWRDTFPGMGNLMAEDWQPEQTWAETYHFYVPEDAQTQRAYTLIAGLYDPATERALPAASSGQEVVPIIGSIAIHGDLQPGGPPPAYQFYEENTPVIGLGTPEIRRTEAGVDLCLPWTSLQPTDHSYHVFVHMLDTQGALIHQVDGEPKAGGYPTSVWWPGERIFDCVALGELPEGGWTLRLGLYALPTGQRLEVRDAQDQIVQDAAIIITP